MSSWRAVMTYNKYSQVAARAVRQALKEPERIKAEKRSEVTLKKQTWSAGEASESRFVNAEAQNAVDKAAAPKGPSV